MTDKEIAEEYRHRVIEAHRPLTAVLDEALAAGFEISVQAGRGADGKIAVQQVKVMRVL